MEVSALDTHTHQIQGGYFHGFHIRVTYGIRRLLLNILADAIAVGRRLGDVSCGGSASHSQDLGARLHLLKIAECESFGDQVKSDTKYLISALCFAAFSAQ